MSYRLRIAVIRATRNPKLVTININFLLALQTLLQYNFFLQKIIMPLKCSTAQEFEKSQDIQSLAKILSTHYKDYFKDISILDILTNRELFQKAQRRWTVDALEGPNSQKFVFFLLIQYPDKQLILLMKKI